jgi:hypothetical protein
MNIAQLGMVSSLPVQARPGAGTDHRIANQFDTLLYRLLLQTTQWTTGISNGHKAENVVFGEMMTDFIAQEAARQQSGFGQMLLNKNDKQEGGRT